MSKPTQHADDRPGSSSLKMADNLPRCEELDKNDIVFQDLIVEVSISEFEHVACLDGKNNAG